MAATRSWLPLPSTAMTDEPSHPLFLSGKRFKADPYPAYGLLRENEPLYCRTSADGQARMWFLTRYEDVAAALRDHRRFVKDVYNTLPAGERAALPAAPPLYRLLTHHMLNADGATHARLRALVNQAFTARMVEQMAPALAAMAGAAVARLAPRGAMELIGDFALPFAVEVIGAMLGVDERDHGRLAAWSHVLVAPSASSARNEAKTARLGRVMADFAGYLEQLCVARRRQPRNDLVSSLLAAEEAGDRLTQEELYSMVLLIIVVGHETSVHLIGNAVRNLLAEPSRWAALQGVPTLLPHAVEELIRFDGPVERATMRFAAEDLDLYGRTIRRGDAVSLVLASANRDPAAFPTPDVCDLARNDHRHLGFGLGVHYCLGAPLARLEVRVALAALLEQLPDLALAAPAETLRWHTNPILRGTKRLPVRWTP